MPIEDQFRAQLNALLARANELLDEPLTPAWRDGLTHLTQTLAYVEPRLGAAHPRPFLLERHDGIWQLTKPDDDWYKRYRDLHAVLDDVTQNDWFDVYLAENVRGALDAAYDAPETTREMCDWLTETLNREDAPMRPTKTGMYELIQRGDMFHLEVNGREAFVKFSAEHTLNQLHRFTRSESVTEPIYMDARIERHLQDAFAYVDPPVRVWLSANRRKLRLAAMQEHFDQRVARGDI